MIATGYFSSSMIMDEFDLKVYDMSLENVVNEFYDTEATFIGNLEYIAKFADLVRANKIELACKDKVLSYLAPFVALSKTTRPFVDNDKSTRSIEQICQQVNSSDLANYFDAIKACVEQSNAGHNFTPDELKAVEQALRRQERKDKHELSDLPSFLIVPTQRGPRYELLLKDALKQASDEQRLVIQNAIDIIHQYTQQINHTLELVALQKAAAGNTVNQVNEAQGNKAWADFLLEINKPKSEYNNRFAMDCNKKSYFQIVIPTLLKELFPSADAKEKASMREALGLKENQSYVLLQNIDPKKCWEQFMYFTSPKWNDTKKNKQKAALWLVIITLNQNPSASKDYIIDAYITLADFYKNKILREHNKLQAAATHLISALEQETLMTDISDDLMGRLQRAIDACNEAGDKKNKSPLTALRRKVRDGDKVLKVPDSSSFASSSRSASLSPSLSTSHSSDSISDLTDKSNDEADTDSSQDVPARKAPQPPLQAPPILVTPAMRSNSGIEHHEVLNQRGRSAQKAEKHSDQTKELQAVKDELAARKEKADAQTRELESEQASRKEAEARITDLQTELAAGKQNAEAQTRELEREQASRKEAEARIADLQTELAAGTQNAEAQTHQLESEQVSRKEAEARIADLETELAAGKENAEVQIRDLEREQASREDAEARIADLETELAAIQEKAKAGTKRGWPLIIAGTVGILAAAALVVVGIVLTPVGLGLLAAGAVATGILVTGGTAFLGFGIRSEIKHAKAKQGYMPIPSETETVSRNRTSSRDTTQSEVVQDRLQNDGVSYTPLHSASFTTRRSVSTNRTKDTSPELDDDNSPSKR